MRGTWGAGRGGEVTLGHCFHPVKHLYADIAYGWLPAQDYVPLMANAAGLAIRLLALGSPPGHGNEQLDRPHPRRKKVRHSDNNGINNIIICDLFCPPSPHPPSPLLSLFPLTSSVHDSWCLRCTCAKLSNSFSPNRCIVNMHILLAWIVVVFTARAINYHSFVIFFFSLFVPLSLLPRRNTVNAETEISLDAYTKLSESGARQNIGFACFGYCHEYNLSVFLLCQFIHTQFPHFSLITKLVSSWSLTSHQRHRNTPDGKHDFE